MKKIFLIITFILWIISFDCSFASYTYLNQNTETNIYSFYKQAILTRAQIKKDFSDWDSMNNSIEQFFIKIELSSNKTTTLNNLKTKLETILNKNKNSSLTTTQTKTINIIKNLYYRTIIALKD